MMISSQSQQNKEKENDYLKKGFLKHFIYHIFERSNETPNSKKGGREGVFGLKNYIIDN